jgi:hypothetical protein
MQTTFVKDLVASGAQLRRATGEEIQGAFDQAAERATNQGDQGVTNQGDRGATGKSVRSRGHEWRKIGKSFSELQLKRTETKDPETSNFGGLSILCLGCS